MSNSMKVIMAKAGSRCEESEAFYLKEQPIPIPEKKDLLVKAISIGMNPVDTKIRQRMDEDKVLGWDVFGIVEETGEAVSGFTKGDRVFYAGALNRPGGNSEYHLVRHELAARVPETISPEDAAAMPLTSITAWEGLFDRLQFKAAPDANGESSVLIIGGAGGVGSVAIQLARWAGLRVYATASRPDTIEWCKQMGADVILNHRNDLNEELKSSGADQVDAIFCTTQMERHWNAMSSCIKPQGKIALIDDPSGPLDIRIFKMKSVALCWEFMYTRSMFDTDDMEEQGKLLSNIAALIDQGVLSTTRQETHTGFSLENIQKMHIKQESGSMIGKQVLVL